MTGSRVLFVAPVEPWCRENGSSVTIADLLDELAGIQDVTLLAAFVRRPPPGYARHEPPGLRWFLLDIDGLPRWASVVGSLLTGSTPLRMRFNNGKVARRLLTELDQRDFQPDIVHVEHLPLIDIGIRVARATGARLVFRAHNVESQLWARRLGPGWIQRRLIGRMERLEADASRSADLTLCISEGDLAWVRARAPGARAEVFPCALKTGRYAAAANGGRRSGQMCFVGGLDWGPNEAGLRWFVDSVLDRITARVPQAKLAVLARGGADRPWVAQHPAIVLVPPESDAPSVFGSSMVSIAPLFQGGGVRIKIPESLALGCPVVATSIGGEGHQLPGMTTADDPDAFAAACVRHLQAPVAPGDTTLREAVEARYGAKGLAERLVEHWSHLLRSHRAKPR